MNKVVLTWIAGALLLLAPATGVVAQEEEESDVTVEDGKASIEYEQTIEEVENSVEITFDTSKAEFEVKIESESEQTSMEEKLESKLHQLVEYEDENGNGAYDDGEPVFSSYLLSEEANQIVDGPNNGTVQWKDLTVEDAQADDGTEGKHIQARGHFQPSMGLPSEVETLVPGQANATFGVDLFVYGAQVQVNGTELGPTEVKADYLIKDYPYTKNTTALALIQETKTESEREFEHDEDDSEGVRAGHTVGPVAVDLVYTWAKHATVDGEETAVHSTVLDSRTEEENETETDEDGNVTESESEVTVEHTTALSYTRGDEILHDPIIGAALAQSSTAGQLQNAAEEIPSIGLLGLLAATGLAATVLVSRD